MDWERARSEEQKEERIKQIIRASLTIFDVEGYEAVSFSRIAALNKSARSNIYKYFSTREEIFLEILRREIKSWGDALVEALKEEFTTAECSTDLWIRALTTSPYLSGLLGMLYTTLEKNVSPEALRRFKKTLAEASAAATRALIEGKVFQDAQTAERFLVAQFSLAMGIFPLMKLTEQQINAMAGESLHTEPGFYTSVLKRSMMALIVGFRDI